MSSRSAQVTVVKPHYKAIATPVISLLSSFVTRPGDREGAGRRRDTWIVRASDTWLTDRRGQTGRSGGQASLPSLLNVAIPPPPNITHTSAVPIPASAPCDLLLRGSAESWGLLMTSVPPQRSLCTTCLQEKSGQALALGHTHLQDESESHTVPLETSQPLYPAW